jgi:hypothetical protein
MSGRFSEPAEGIHYEIYWLLDNGDEMKISAMRQLRMRIMKTIEETGREYYSVWRADDDSCFYYAQRDELYPVKAG